MEQAILAMAASSAGGVTQEDGSSGKSALRFFPGEEPSNKEVGDWLDDDSLPKIRLVFGALLRNETPTHLQVYKTLDDMTGFEIVPDGEDGWQPSQIAAHNRKVREAISARADGDDEPPLPWLSQRAGEHALALERRLGRARSRALQAPRRERVALALPAAR